MSSSHFYVVEHPSGVFHVARNAKHGVHGRFGSREDAHAHAAKLKRDYLTPALDKFGNPLTPRARAVLGVWHPKLYAEALARGRKRDAVTA